MLQTVNDTNGVPQLIMYLLDNCPCMFVVVVVVVVVYCLECYFTPLGTHKPPEREWVRTQNYKDHSDECKCLEQIT